MVKILVAAQEKSINCAIREIRENFEVLQIKKLVKGVFICEINETFEKIFEKFFLNKPIFIRYILPILLEKRINAKNNANIEELLKNINPQKDDIFVLHLSILNDNSKLNKENIITDCFEYFKKNNIIINPKKANRIIGLIVFDDILYFGTSAIKDSLSSWIFGESRFKNEDGQISRAEFKLLEAFEYFNINLSNYKNALDLGAAPGGWTRVLLNKGLSVVAVDPAELDKRLLKNKNLYHYKGLSQDFFKECKNKKFDIIVNDMKMDTKKSIQIVENAAKYLNNNGIIITTLKLNPNREFEEIKECINIIRQKHKIIGIHQLFHNRSEATIVFNKLTIL